MNLLFISKNGSSLSTAQRVKEEKHNVTLFLVEEQSKLTGNGIIHKPTFNKPIVRGDQPISSAIDALLKEVDPDLVVFDMVHLGRVADYIRKRGIAVFGACRWADDAELDRIYGYKLMKAVSINVPPTTIFKSGEHEKASTFVKQNKNKRYVYKPSGNVDSAHTYIAEGADDLIAMLKLWRNDKCEFELQEFVEGVEVSCELWWNGLSSSAHNITFEEKKFMNDNVGPTVGCAGNVVRTVSRGSRIVKEGIGKMERLLKKTNYRGPIDLNSIVTQDKLFGLEFTIRFGYDALQALLELHRGSITKLLWSVARGTQSQGEFTSDHAIAVRVSIPPYPHVDDPKWVQQDVPILGINAENSKHIWLTDAYRDKDGYLSAGVAGDVLTATARGRDVMECRKRVYRTINNLIIPQKQFRTDIGVRVNEDERKLTEWGWI